VQDTADVVQEALSALARGKRTIIPNWSGRISGFAVRFLPVGFVTWGIEKLARGDAERACAAAILCLLPIS
jgi:short-subunit dehydrogenase